MWERGWSSGKNDGFRNERGGERDGKMGGERDDWKVHDYRLSIRCHGVTNGEMAHNYQIWIHRNGREHDSLPSTLDYAGTDALMTEPSTRVRTSPSL